MIEFADSERAEELAQALIEDVVLPRERDLAGGMSISSSAVTELRDAAREYGIYAPQIEAEHGGMGEDSRDILAVFEEAGRSLLGPVAIQIDAPDGGNMHLLELQGTELRKEQYLQPLVDGEIKSAFSMTEPMQGAGSDPKMIQTTAEKDGDERVIDGHNCYSTQGIEAGFRLVFARTDQDAHPHEGYSVFIISKRQTASKSSATFPTSALTSLGRATPKSSTTASAFLKNTCLGPRAMDSNTFNNRSARRDSPTVCAFPAWPSARSISRRPT